jgi:hypothetical protein
MAPGTVVAAESYSGLAGFSPPSTFHAWRMRSNVAASVMPNGIIESRKRRASSGVMGPPFRWVRRHSRHIAVSPRGMTLTAATAPRGGNPCDPLGASHDQIAGVPRVALTAAFVPLVCSTGGKGSGGCDHCPTVSNGARFRAYRGTTDNGLFGG